MNEEDVPMGVLVSHEMMGITRVWGVGASDLMCFRAAQQVVRDNFSRRSAEILLGAVQPGDFEGLAKLIANSIKAASLLDR